jgi:uncharacterized membrane protein YkoI
MTARNPIILGAIAAMLASTGAFAQPPAPAANDAGPVGSAKVTLDAAVATAEKHVQGKASKAEYEKQKGGQWVYDVEVVAGAKVFDVKVDADKGTVIVSAEDHADTDDEGDAAD